jgi:hypothetical protein
LHLSGMLERTITVNGLLKLSPWQVGELDILAHQNSLQSLYKIQGQPQEQILSLAYHYSSRCCWSSVLKLYGRRFHNRRDLVVGLLKKFQGKINVQKELLYSQTFLLSSEKHWKEPKSKCNGFINVPLAKLT